MAYKTYDTPMTGYSNYYIRLGYEVLSQDLAQNTSTVKYVMYIGFTSGTGIHNGYNDSRVRLTVNGEVKRNDLTSYDFRTTRQYTISEGTQVIQHDSSGKATLRLEGHWDPALDGYLPIKATTATFGVNLPDLARSKGFTFERTSMNFGTSQTITIQGHTAGYSYDIKMNHGSSTYTMGSTTNGTFRLTVGSNFLSIVPNSTSTTVTIAVVTKLGARVVGEEVKNLTLIVPDTYRPSPPNISFSNLDDSAVSRFNSQLYFLNQSSRMGAQVIPQGNFWGARITGFEARIVTQPDIQTVGQSAMLAFKPFTFHKGENKGYQIEGRVRDSRGRYSDWAKDSRYFYILDYQAPRLMDIKAERTGSGTSVSITRTYEVSPLTVNGRNYNTARLTFQTRQAGQTSWINNSGASSTLMKLTNSPALLSGSFAPTGSYEIKAILTDDFRTVEMIIPLGTESVPLDISKEGIGVGKIHETGKGVLQVKGGRSFMGEPPAIEAIGDVRIDGNLYIQFNGSMVPITTVIQHIVSNMIRR